MVKMKQTPRHSDAAGKLPPLAPRHRQEGWGTAAETFHKQFRLPQDPRRGDVSYKGRSDWSNRIINNVTDMLHCTVFHVEYVELSFVLTFTQGCLPRVSVQTRGTTNHRLGDVDGGLGRRPSMKLDMQ